ncbi:MAG: sigma-70 family RNA polymerase sigma factor [Planctomycetaceae bacterium]
MTLPDTRPSLLLRVRDANDGDAWDEFTAIYRPVILRLAGIKGLQDADAEDLAQQVLLAVSHAVERWKPDAARGRFRTWLHTVANNAILNALTRGVRDRAAADESIDVLLQQQLDRVGSDSDLLRTEYRREIFSRAAQQIRTEFAVDTWNSFWLTAVDGVDVDVAAVQLGRTRGSVYASRSRVMKRLKQKVKELDVEE